MKDLIIIGAGGVGRETALIVEEINAVDNQWNLLGFVDEDIRIQGQKLNNYPVLGTINFLEKYSQEVFVVCAIANYEVKKKIINKLNKNHNIQYATIIHPSARLNKHINIGEGCIIYQEVVMTVNIKIGKHVIVSPKTGIGHDAIINDYCSLLWTTNISGNVEIGEGVLVGSGATIIQNIRVGETAIIGAGAVVIKNVEKAATVIGVPAKELTTVRC